jgi:hypothetical protein
MKRSLAVIATILVGSCHYGVRDISTVPDNPTFNRDIYPLFADHCLVCHSSPPNRGAPAYFRLDVYDDTDGGNVAGANSMAGLALNDVVIGKMPPEAKVGDGVGPNGLKMLQKWVENGNPQ